MKKSTTRKSFRYQAAVATAADLQKCLPELSRAVIRSIDSAKPGQIKKAAFSEIEESSIFARIAATLKFTLLLPQWLHRSTVDQELRTRNDDFVAVLQARIHSIGVTDGVAQRHCPLLRHKLSIVTLCYIYECLAA
jgi:predicted secreted Zn-dependent protease